MEKNAALETGNTSVEQVCQQAEYGEAIQEAARTHTEIVYGMFLANFLMIFTGRFLVREDPLTIKILNKEIYQFDIDINEKWVLHLDRILFTINFVFVSLYTVLQFVPWGTIKVS